MSVLDAQTEQRARMTFFYAVVGAIVVVLFTGLAYRQLFSNEAFLERERLQNQRRILLPGPRGEILDREGRVFVTNRSQFSAVLFFSDERVRREFRREYLALVRDRRAGNIVIPEDVDLEHYARARVVQRYLDQCNQILGRQEKVSIAGVQKHFANRPLLPFAILDDLSTEEFARLLEQVPSTSPVQIIASAIRHYPYGRSAAHTLGYVSATPDLPQEDLPGGDLRTFNARGTYGRSGLELQFDEQLQGKTGSEIYIVDPAGYRVDLVNSVPPVTGKALTTSLDIDVQLAGEAAFADQEGACVAIDVQTGEVLALISKPDFDLNDTSPFISNATMKDINDRGAFFHRAIQGLYPPGSTFKIISSIAGLRSGAITPDQPIIDCQGVLSKYGRRFVCYNGRGHHGETLLPNAIAQSCDIYFYQVGWLTTPEQVASEARRFALDRPTGIELPYESRGMIVPDPDWKRRNSYGPWTRGDTANMAIGQGYLVFTPLQMACFTASFARDETITSPTILRRPPGSSPARAGNQSTGLAPGDRAAIIAGMEQAVLTGTTKRVAIPGIRLAAKTGTAQQDQKIDGKVQRINFAWTIVFGPIERPTIAVATIVKGDTPDEEYAGGTYAAPIAKAVLQAYFAKHPPLATPARAPLLFTP